MLTVSDDEGGILNEEEAWKQKHCGASLESGVQASSSVHSGCPALPQHHVTFSAQELFAVTAAMFNYFQ